MARGFLGAYDASWMFKGFCEGIDPLELLREREGLFKNLRSILKLQSNTLSYSIDPKTRYSSINIPASGDANQLYDRETNDHTLVSCSQTLETSPPSPPLSHFSSPVAVPSEDQ